MVKKALGAERCAAVAQACGTLVDLDRDSAIAASVGRGTAEIVVIDELEVMGGEGPRWASCLVTGKMGRFARLGAGDLGRNRDLCKRYSRILAEDPVREVCDVSEGYGNRYPIAPSGGGLLIPGVNVCLASGLKKFDLLVPDDPVMSSARGPHKLAE